MMGTVNMIVPPLHPTRFTGGIWCVMEYARGLARLGHRVNVVPMLPSKSPTWIEGGYRVVALSPAEAKRKGRNAFWRIPGLYGWSLFSGKGRAARKAERRKNLNASLLARAGDLPYEVRKAVSLRYLRGILPDADATVATLFETALAVSLIGGGRKFYFMQHFEPYFKDSYEDPWIAEQDAMASYRMGLHMIANSSWLRQTVAAEVPDGRISLCTNAIDHRIFHGEPKDAEDGPEVKVISYGGRDVEWKGFRDMAEAMRIVRSSLPRKNVRWLVYGDAVLPPDNGVARYEPLGFLMPDRLARAYREADILLSASWYESFPLFPIEAMACGLPVVTTRLGTEDYAFPGETAEVVEARNPESIASGLLRLIEDRGYRNRIARKGNEISREFTWERSVGRMDGILFGGPRPEG